MITGGVPHVVTYRNDMTNARWLANYGHVTGINYSFVLPGGCDQMQCNFAAPPSWRIDGLALGRVVQVILNGSVIWDGHMLEPVPTSSGWNITAVGTASWSNNYRSVYTGAWGTGTPDNAVNAAIVRGLRWTNPGIGSPSGMWVGQAVDSGAQTITDLLNLICSNGGLTWYVAPKGNILSVFTLPTTVNRLLTAYAPVARTLGGNLTRIYERYQNTNDGAGGAATFALTNSDDATGIALFGEPLEDYIDLSSVGLISTGAAQTVGNLILKRYQRASFSGPFTVTPGLLMTTGGQAIDLATEQAGNVVRLLIMDAAYAGEEVTGPPTFLVGAYAYDVDSTTATITPFQSLNMSADSIIGAPWTTVATKADVRFARRDARIEKLEAKRRAAARARARHKKHGRK